MAHTTISQPNKTSGNRKDGSPAVRPFRITWQGKSYQINNIERYRTTTENGAVIHSFTATDGAGSFELKFTTSEMAWFLGSDK